MRFLEAGLETTEPGPETGPETDPGSGSGPGSGPGSALLDPSISDLSIFTLNLSQTAV